MSVGMRMRRCVIVVKGIRVRRSMMVGMKVGMIMGIGIEMRPALMIIWWEVISTLL